MAFPGIALAAVLVAVFGGGIPVLVLRDRVPLHPAGGPGGPGQRAGPVRRGLRGGGAGHRRAHAAHPAAARRGQLRRAGAGVLHGAWSPTPSCSRRRCRSSAPGVRPPDPSWGSVIADGKNMVLTRRLVGDRLPRPADPDHRAGAEHPVRGRLRRVGGARPRGDGDRPRRPALDRRRGRPARAATGQVLELPGLTEAARRLAERARPLPDGPPVLEVDGPGHRLRGPARRRGHRRRHLLRRAPRRGPGPGRRVGLRQVADRADRHGPRTAGARGSGAQVRFDRHGPADHARCAPGGGCSATTWR